MSDPQSPSVFDLARAAADGSVRLRGSAEHVQGFPVKSGELFASIDMVNLFRAEPGKEKA
jgi:hypothetical protein